MKTITIAALASLLHDDARWTTEQDYDSHSEEQWDGNEDESRRVVYVTGHAWRTSSTQLDGGRVALTYNEQWNAVEFDTDSLKHEAGDYAWELEGVQLVDEDGELLELSHELPYMAGDGLIPAVMTEIDWTFLSKAAGFNAVDDIDNDIDNDMDNDMETFTLENDNAPNVRFNGELVATASSFAYNRNDRWTELYLYRSVGGKHVCQTIGRTQWQDETNRHTVEVVDSDAAVVEIFGYGRLAKEIYSEANIEHVQDVE